MTNQADNAAEIAKLGRIADQFRAMRADIGQEISDGKLTRNIARDWVQGAFDAARKMPRKAKDLTPWLVIPGRGKAAGIGIWKNMDWKGNNHPHNSGYWKFHKIPRNMVKRLKSKATLFPTGKGFLQASWIGPMKALGMKVGMGKVARKISPAFDVIDRTMPGEANMTVRNAMYYIGKLDARAGMMQAGIRNAINRMEKQIQLMQSRADRGWAQ